MTQKKFQTNDNRNRINKTNEQTHKAKIDEFVIEYRIRSEGMRESRINDKQDR